MSTTMERQGSPTGGTQSAADILLSLGRCAAATAVATTSAQIAPSPLPPRSASPPQLCVNVVTGSVQRIQPVEKRTHARRQTNNIGTQPALLSSGPRIRGPTLTAHGRGTTMKRRTWQCRIHALEASQRVQKPVRALVNLLRQRTEPAVNSNTSGAADILLPIQPPLVRPVRIGSSGDPRMSTRKEIADCLEHAFVISLKTFSIDLQCISNFKAALNDAVDTIYTKSLLHLACASEVCSDNTLLLPQGTSETKRNNYTLPTLARFPAPLWLHKLQRVHCLFHNAFWDITDLKSSDLVAIPVFHMTRSTFDSDHDTSHRATLQGGTGTEQVDAENKLELTCTMRWVILPATITGNLSPYEVHIVRTQTSVMHNSNIPVANNKDVTNFLTFVQLTKTIAPISNEEQQYLDTVFRDRLKDASSSVHKHMRNCQSIYSKRNGPVPSHDPVAHMRYMLGFLHSYIPFMCE